MLRLALLFFEDNVVLYFLFLSELAANCCYLLLNLQLGSHGRFIGQRRPSLRLRNIYTDSEELQARIDQAVWEELQVLKKLKRPTG